MRDDPKNMDSLNVEYFSDFRYNGFGKEKSRKKIQNTQRKEAQLRIHVDNFDDIKPSKSKLRTSM